MFAMALALFGGGGDRFVCALSTRIAFRLAKSRSVCGLSAKLLARSFSQHLMLHVLLHLLLLFCSNGVLNDA